MEKVFGIDDALASLQPKGQWTLSGAQYGDLVWLSANIPMPTGEEVITEVVRLQAEYDALEYQRLRAPEYPPLEDYVDGVVKGDQAQIDAYIAACRAVKEKYPKPE